MADHRSNGKKASVVAPDNLKRAIQHELNRHRGGGSRSQIDADDPIMQDGFWQCVVHTGSKKAGKIATVLATVEEEIMGSYGVNVMLVPASD